MFFGFKITKNFAWELSLFHLIRKFLDGISWLNFQVESDWFEGDHNPQFEVILIILNVVIFEFRIYNVNHVEEIKQQKAEKGLP